MNKKIKLSEVYSLTEAAELLNMTVPEIIYCLGTGELDGDNNGANWFIPGASLRDYKPGVIQRSERNHKMAIGYPPQAKAKTPTTMDAELEGIRERMKIYPAEETERIRSSLKTLLLEAAKRIVILDSKSPHSKLVHIYVGYLLSYVHECASREAYWKAGLDDDGKPRQGDKDE